MERFIKDIKSYNAAPFLFLGSGFSRRYMGTPSWEKLLEECATWVDKSIKQYVSKVKKINTDNPMYLPLIAKMIAEDFEEVWWNSPSYKKLSKENEKYIRNYASPLKIATSSFIKKFQMIEDDDKIKLEIESLRRLSEKNSIDGIITTNWDCLAEEIFGFERFIGQEKLLFSNVYNVGEIFKIHGCISEPNSMIFDYNDYDSFNKRHHYLASKLTTIFIEHPIVFIGYSLRDDNIRDILNSIIYGIGEENLKKFGESIFFLEYNFDDDKFIYTTMPIDLPAGKLDITYIKTNDFIGIFEALGENERKFPARLVRQMKSHLYDLLLTDDPKEQIYVATNLDDKEEMEKVQFVYGAGVIEKLSNVGYDVESNDNLLRDIVGIGAKKYDYKEIVQRTLLTANKYHLPVHSFIKKSGLNIADIHPKILGRRVKSHKELISREKVDGKFIMNKYNSIKEISENEAPHKAIEYALYFSPSRVNIEELEELITTNINYLKNGKPSEKTNLRKLIKYYDWLRYA